MDYENSLVSLGLDLKGEMRVIADNMLRLRPRGEVTYHPYRKNGVYYDKHLDLRIIDLKKLYPNAQKGNVVYVSTVIEACVRTDAKINFIGNAKVYFKGECIFDSESDVDSDGRCRCALHLNEGENPILFMVRCEDDGKFEFRFMPSVRWYWVWAKCYLLSARATSPLPCYRGEDGLGISRLYQNEHEAYEGDIAYPVPEKFDQIVDFYRVFPEKTGDYFFGLTYALSDTKLTLYSENDIFVTVNGEEKGSPLSLKAGDRVLLRLRADGDRALFRFDGDGIGIPFMRSERATGDEWLTLGGFNSENYRAVEENIQFKAPYIGCNGRSVFWKLMGENDYLRPYLSTRFFGQWHYTFMVGGYGLLNAYRTLGEKRYGDYFRDHMKLMVEYFDYMRYELKNFSSPSFLDISSTLHDLDSIGSIGRNLCEYYSLTADDAVIPVINTLLEAMETNIPRFEDGTFHRERDMWADDTFMSCPFLVRAGKLKGDSSYYRQAIKQLLGFRKRLWMEDKRLFSHIFFLDTEKSNRVPWGRGNGWVFVSMSDVLQNAPADTEGYGELLRAYREFAVGIISAQDGDGLWHQVLDRHDSYSETSCTGMFIIGLCRGIRNGWLSEGCIDAVIRAYNALISMKIDSDGAVYDVCMGSGNSTEAEYYMQLGTVDNDDHGTGVILTALSEILKTESVMRKE
ncbi:MAG: glycoside hydrolase family 88 protein [Clostridia bacterium]|nr:glycoside hydrolase family 88 protein [Clostridia bacterium]